MSYALEPRYSLCCGAKIGIPCTTQFYCIKAGFKGVYISRKCFSDGYLFHFNFWGAAGVGVGPGTSFSCPRHEWEMSRLMGKPTICIGENKDADQLRGNRKADQRLCFRYSDSTIPLLPKSEISSF